MRRILLIGVLLVSGTLFACTKGEQSDDQSGQAVTDKQVLTVEGKDIERWLIQPERVPCEEGSEALCYKVQREDSEEYELIASIQGFAPAETALREVYVVDVRVSDPSLSTEAESVQAEGTEDLQGASKSGFEVVKVHEGEEENTGEQSPTDTLNKACTSHSDCAEGQQCRGPAGCDKSWQCKPARPCTKDIQIYCSCEGKTVRGSGSCPPVPYKHRGLCADKE